MYYLAAFAIIFGVNLLPAFGPPTWMLLVMFRLNWHLNPVMLVIVGALAAGTGRYLLGIGSYRMRNHIGQRRLANLEVAKKYLTGHKAKSVLGIALFALSPVPSAQMFVAAGVLGLPILPLTLAFFAGRLVSYSFYVTAATLAQRSFGDILASSLTSPWGIALQVAMLGVVVVLSEVNWQKLIDRHASKKSTPEQAATHEVNPDD